MIRKRRLPPGWYPESPEEIRAFLSQVEGNPPERGALAALAPHAGWYYSGSLAARAAAALRVPEGAGDPETVVVIGGHLPAGYPPLFIEEEGVETPLGDMPIDGEFRALLRKELGGRPDRYEDNTVEVQLPMVKFFFPRAKLLALRLPAEPGSFEAGRGIAQIGASLGRKLLVLGSTDLTHYGYNYDFYPRGLGKGALDWVKTVNDRAFIAGVIAGDPGEALARAERDRSACSAGAVLACLGYAEAAAGAGNKTDGKAGNKAGCRTELLAYGTSADVPGNKDNEVPDSFVGYAALAWYGIGKED
ncbi:MAG: AmmeMemoRadiSam system protein B [Spirochaetaceae bacterium]|jgi:AmmeMemoRadiSam system protein B|nr:AmmeMemoRadiSam system protein B [Spirochaetaceae bacterium]